MAIHNVQMYIEQVALPVGTTVGTNRPDNYKIKAAQRAISIFNSNLAPSVAKDAFLTQIRKLWDAQPLAEAKVNDAIVRSAAAVAGRNDKADALLNPTPPAKFSSRQLLKYMSWDLAFLFAVTGNDEQVVETSLDYLSASGSMTTWLNQSRGYDRKAIVHHVITHWNGPLTTPMSSESASALTAQSAKEINTMTDTAVATVSAPKVDARMEPAVNAVLASAGVPMQIDALLSAVARVNEAEAAKQNAVAAFSQLSAEMSHKNAEIDALQRKVKQAQSVSTVYTVPAQTNTGMPTGTSSMVKAASLFPVLKNVDFDIPAWSWSHQHPDVPAINDAYIFRKEMLVKFLLCLKRGDNTWFQGHTGSGKTTFVEQVAARLQWPVARIAFDSAIDRSELVGRMQLSATANGGTTSTWLKGVLELAIPNGYMMLCDEFDAGRPDALYVLQEVLEHKAKRLLEDGGRFIDYHPMTRLVATGNTCGSGDPSGIYPATRILSGATLDRFSCFIHVPYMTQAEEEELIKSSTSLNSSLIARMSKFATEMRHAFVKAEIPISYSPRRSVAFARATEDFMSILGTTDKAIDKSMSLAIQQTVYDAAPEEFRQRIVEIARSSLGGSINPTVSL